MFPFPRRLSVRPRSTVPLIEFGSTDVLLMFSSLNWSSTVMRDYWIPLLMIGLTPDFDLLALADHFCFA